MASSETWWTPQALARRRPYLEARQRIAEALRAWFRAAGFAEVETPALQVSPGMEPHLRAFATELETPGAEARALYLHTSPEFAMKKLLAAGAGPIFQLARVWRNGERSATHHPEFTMLEWYRPGAGYRDLIEDCRHVLGAALSAAGSAGFRWQGRAADSGPIEVMSVAEAFRKHAGLDLLATIDADGTPNANRFRDLAAQAGVRTTSADTWDDVFFRVFLERIEPKIGSPHPTAVIDYPVHMAALSRPSPEDPRLAERFELYVCGLELANAFGELTDAHEQRRRFLRDQALKRRLYGIEYPIDEDFLAALQSGLPESAGIALGFDRLVMLATGARSIEDVLWAPVAGG
ncbi:MAG TPA: EF-P lysine aminoacylase EpmA [Candidatus Cybelea sp.]|nr:EF-P lysine aminoacylase EpmA [Candidatus Cybelea sp.]